MGSFYETRPVMTLSVGTVGVDRGRIVGADRALGNLLGVDSDSLLDRPIADVVHPESRDEACEQFARVVARKCRRFDGVFRVIAAGGSVRWLSIHACLTSNIEPELLLLRVFALPVRLLALDTAKAQRTSSTDRLAVALDLAPVSHARFVA